MTTDAASTSTYDKIVATLKLAGASFDVIDHAPEGRTDIASQIRGNPLSAAAKAMVVKIKTSSGPVHALVVVGGDKRVDFTAVAASFGGRSASFAAPHDASDLTGCVMGSVPPFSFDERLSLIVDEDLAREERIYFNAGRLDRSFAIQNDGYLRAAQPRIARVAQ